MSVKPKYSDTGIQSIQGPGIPPGGMVETGEERPVRRHATYDQEEEIKLSNKFKPDVRNVVSFSLMGPESGGLMNVDSNDGKITRMRPYFYDKEYVEKNCNPWTMEARGSTFVPPNRVLTTLLAWDTSPVCTPKTA